MESDGDGDSDYCLSGCEEVDAPVDTGARALLELANLPQPQCPATFRPALPNETSEEQAAGSENEPKAARTRTRTDWVVFKTWPTSAPFEAELRKAIASLAGDYGWGSCSTYHSGNTSVEAWQCKAKYKLNCK